MAISRGAWCSVRILSRKVTLLILSFMINAFIQRLLKNIQLEHLWKFSFYSFSSEKQLRTPGLVTSPITSTILSPKKKKSVYTLCQSYCYDVFYL